MSPAEGASIGLLDLQLREEADEPLEALLVPVDQDVVMSPCRLQAPVDPKEVDLPEAPHNRAQFLGPTVLTVRASQLGLASR